jgi:flagellar M-ring protein FliF
MIEKLAQYKNKIVQLWKKQSKFIKWVLIGSAVFLIALILFTAALTKAEYVPLYSNLSAEETGQIKETLDSKGVKSNISDGGTTISVPKNQVDSLKVELAAEGIPNSGNIDYSFFGENAGFGMTDNEFGVLKQEAMQTEISNLISNINGVEQANVMINLPEDSVWVSDQKPAASASVVLNLKPGYDLKDPQVQALYHLVSKSVPDLSVDNIVIMDEMFNYYESGKNNSNSALSAYQEQRQIKQDIEQDLQRQLQQMLGMMIGRDKVVVSVTTDIDFTKENRVEDLVKPVDEENTEGLQVSVERIRETYSGNADGAGGVAGTGETDIPGYEAGTGEGNGDYERVEERINNEVNRIRKEIVESPYTIRDVGLQVMVEPPDPDNPDSLPVERVNDIEQILSTMIRTTISQNEGDPLTNEEITEKIYVSVQPFDGKAEVPEPAPESIIPIWLYVTGAVIVLILILFIYLLLRKNKQTDADEEFSEQTKVQPTFHVPDVNEEKGETEGSARRKQLERMAKEQPEQFANLLRSWISEE